MKYPNLSIIIPHYNTPKLLKKLLDTIPMLDDIQVIVVDDNSTIEIDFYNELCTKYRHISFLTNESDKNSAGTCRNIGVQHSTGRWILFADADDYFSDDFYDIISEYFDSDYDIVFFPPASIDLETGSTSNRHIPFDRLVKNYLGSSSYKDILRLRYLYLSPWSKLISKKYLENNNILFEETLIANDIMFSVLLGHHAKNITADSRILYTITMRKASITTVLNENKIFIRLEVFVRQYNFLKEKLSKKDFRTLDIAGGTYIFAALRNKYPLRTIFKMIALMKKNKVRVFRRKYLNPAHVLGELKARSKKYEKDYYKYEKKRLKTTD